MVRVVVVDDEPMVCAHLRTILGSAEDIEVVDEAHDGAAAVEAVVRSRPDVVLMDLRMPGVDGLTAIERISELADPPAVVVLTTFDADQYVLRALRAGAAGFLVKSTPPEDLIGLVRVAADGHTVLSPAAARRLIAASTDGQLGPRPRAAAGRLADRAGGRGARLPRRGTVERADRGAAVPVGGHGQGIRVADAGQAGLRQPHPGRAARPRRRRQLTGCSRTHTNCVERCGGWANLPAPRSGRFGDHRVQRRRSRTTHP